MNLDFLHALDDIEKEKGISKEILLEAIETALISAYKKDFGSKENVRVELNSTTGEVHVYTKKKWLKKYRTKILKYHWKMQKA